MKENKLRTPTFFESIFPILFLIIFLSINVFIFKDSSLDGSNQIVLIVSASVASAIALNIGFKWSELQKGIVNSISSALPSILILFLVGGEVIHTFSFAMIVGVVIGTYSSIFVASPIVIKMDKKQN